MHEYAKALSTFRALTDRKTGIIRRVQIAKVLNTDPQVFLVHAEPCNTIPLTGIEAANQGAACSPRLERAIVRACGESVERYCSAFFPIHRLKVASEQELITDGESYVPVHQLYPFADWQFTQADFPYTQATPTSNVRWVQGHAMHAKKDVWLPASCAYVPYLFDKAVEPFTHMPISTGLAAGPDIGFCIEKGIMEILERDALMVNWYARLPAPRVDPASCWGIMPEIDQLLSAATPGGPTWHLNLLTLDIEVPIISAALIDPGAPPLTSFGISASLDPARALLLALEEAALTRTLLNRNQEILSNRGYVHERLHTLRDHLLAHATSPALRESLCFLTNSPSVLSFDDLAKRTQIASAHDLSIQLEANGFDPIWIDVTTPDVRDFGICVVRTVIPGMQPLDNDHRYRYLGGQRLLSVPRKLGYPLTLEELNPAPHPFP